MRNQNVIDPKLLDKAIEGEDEKDDERPEGGMNPKRVKVEPIENHDGIDMAYIITKKNKQSIKLTDEIFQDIVDADPSRNKQYVQWMIKVFNQDNDWLVIDIDDEDKTNYDFYGVGSSDMDVDGIPDDEDDELSVDRFDIRQRIESELNTMLNEVGGYDDKDIMNAHAQSIQAPLLQTLASTVEVLKSFVEMAGKGKLENKEMVTNFISNLTMKIDLDVDMIDRLVYRVRNTIRISD